MSLFMTIEVAFASASMAYFWVWVGFPRVNLYAENRITRNSNALGYKSGGPHYGAIGDIRRASKS
jgi:hypothetical protein